MMIQFMKITLVFGCCAAFQPEITLYKNYLGETYQGDSITLRSKQADLRAISPDIISNIKSVCYKGSWHFWCGKNFTGNCRYPYIQKSNSLVCHNDTSGMFQKFGSGRYLGPIDTTITSLSFYKTGPYDGEEVVVSGPAYTNFPFIPVFVFPFRISSWTFYSETNFQGNTMCFVNNDENTSSGTRLTNFTVKSVVKGCNHDIQNYLYTSDSHTDKDNTLEALVDLEISQ